MIPVIVLHFNHNQCHTEHEIELLKLEVPKA